MLRKLQGLLLLVLLGCIGVSAMPAEEGGGGDEGGAPAEGGEEKPKKEKPKKAAPVRKSRLEMTKDKLKGDLEKFTTAKEAAKSDDLKGKYQAVLDAGKAVQDELEKGDEALKSREYRTANMKYSTAMRALPPDFKAVLKSAETQLERQTKLVDLYKKGVEAQEKGDEAAVLQIMTEVKELLRPTRKPPAKKPKKKKGGEDGAAGKGGGDDGDEGGF